MTSRPLNASYFVALCLTLFLFMSVLSEVALANPSDTPSPTVTETSTQTSLPSSPVSSNTQTPSATATPSQTAFAFSSSTPTLSPTDSPTENPALLSPSTTPTPTATPTMSDTSTASPSATVTNVQSPSMTPSVSPPPAAAFQGCLIANFEDGSLNTINGGSTLVVTDSDGSSATAANVSGGCVFGSALYGCDLQGSLVSASGDTPSAGASFQLVTGGAAVNISPIALQHCLTFSYLNNSPGVSYRVNLLSAGISDGDQYGFNFTPSGTGWQRLTVYFPDVVGFGLPTISQQGFGQVVPWSTCVSQITAVSIVALGSNQSFNLEVDDLTLGPPPSINNPVAVATAFGTSVSTVVAAYSCQVDEEAAWILLVLSSDCNCSPQTIFALRATMS